MAGGRGPQRRRASEQSPERDERGAKKRGVLTSDLHGGCGPKLTHGLLTEHHWQAGVRAGPPATTSQNEKLS